MTPDEYAHDAMILLWGRTAGEAQGVIAAAVRFAQAEAYEKAARWAEKYSPLKPGTALEIHQREIAAFIRMRAVSVCPTESPSRPPEVMSGRLGGEGEK